MNVGDTLGGKYRLDRLLGEGGMGAVYAAENLNTGRRVAIKVLHGEWTQQPQVVQRFLREARATTTIAHPNVVEVFDLDLDRERGIPYIVQEFLEGETLESYLSTRPGRRLDADEALRLLLPVMGALVAAHGRGVVHRDLKPANLFLARSRGGAVVPKVIDFGIAKSVDAPGGTSQHTQAGTAIGTPGYMSPEQVSGMPDVDAQTDVWSIGVVFYEMLTGRLPFESPNVNVLMAKILYEAPTPIGAYRYDLPPGLGEIIGNALRRERSERFGSIRAMLSAILESGVCPPDLVKTTTAPEDGWFGASSTSAASMQPPLSVPPPAPYEASAPWSPNAVPPPMGAQPTQAMSSPASNPFSAQPLHQPADTMHAVSRAVTAPGSAPTTRSSVWLALAALATLILAALAAFVSLRPSEPARSFAAQPALAPSLGTAVVPVDAAAPSPPLNVAAPPPRSMAAVAPTMPSVRPPAPIPPPAVERRPPIGAPRPAPWRPTVRTPREMLLPLPAAAPRRDGPPNVRALNADEM